MLTSPFLEAIKKRINQSLSLSVTHITAQRVYGGDINKTYLLKTNEGNFFLKTNPDAGHADMFEKEATGLQRLKAAVPGFIPATIAEGSIENIPFLLLEYIEPGTHAPTMWQQFAGNLATLHRQSNHTFGLEEDNYIGSLPQHNTPHTTWAEFYAAERLQKLSQKAYDQKLFTQKDTEGIHHICRRLHNIFPPAPPSLLHGDLWNGNYLINNAGHAVVFDAAVYYGHREMDIAMTLLFGGFHPQFYTAYNEHFPLEKNWVQRTDLCQLYPLMVHLLLFGGHYYDSVKNILARYN